MKWYQITCVVKLGTPIEVESGPRKSSSGPAKGYVVVVGLSAQNIVQASIEAHKAALAALNENSNENEIEEMQIKETIESEIRDKLELTQGGTSLRQFYRSGLTFFCE